ncbi:MAG: RNA-binding S4 domain-containing protein [Deltaproteobacteria bacterium]|nr:RNA-binding S4 domain-containing protein [Deltaproteobacteria bacterium]
MRTYQQNETLPVETTVKLTTELIKLDALLKVAAVADSGGQAKHWIQQGLVSVNGERVIQRGKKIRPGDVVDVDVPPKTRIVVE